MTNPDLSYITEALRPLAVPIGELDLMDKNPRKHDGGGQSALAASLKQFGQVKPVVVHADGKTVIAGNGTLDAAISLGWTHIAVVKTGMEGDEAAAYSIADNRVGDLSAFDMDIVGDMLKELDKDMAAATGFIDDLVEDVTGEPEDPPESPETSGTPETVPPGTTGVQRGEGEAGEGGETTSATHGQTYRYSIAFESLEDQEVFYTWLRHLKTAYPDLQTAGERIIAFIQGTGTANTTEENKDEKSNGNG